MTPTPQLAIAETRAWVDRAVIGLNLCPFAKAPQIKGQVRYVASAAQDPAALLADLVAELERLAEAPAEKIDFAEYNDFLEIVDATVDELDLDGILQVASFHPDYQFEGTVPGDVENATNRSPYPTLHLLREESIERAVAAFPEAEAIYETNIDTLQRLGATGWAELQAQCRADIGAPRG